MARIIITITLALFVSGCVYDHNVQPDLKRTRSIIIWNEVDDVHSACNEGAEIKISRIAGRYLGCARWSENKYTERGTEYNVCRITMGKKINVEVLGHEVLHCFVGNFHGEEPEPRDPGERRR